MSAVSISPRAALLAAAALTSAFTPSASHAQETPRPAASPAASSGAVAGGASEIRSAGMDVPVPSRRRYVPPEYPPDAAAQGIRGIVIVEVIVDEEGKVATVNVTRSIPGLDEAAIAAVKLWEYEPTRVSGKPVKVRLSQSITFALKLPDLQRAAGVPEIRSGGLPVGPRTLEAPQTAAVAVTLGASGEVTEAAVVEGSPEAAERLLRAVRSWRFTLAEGATPPSFTVRAEWAAGTPPALTLRALDAKTAASAAAPSAGPASTTAPATGTPATTPAAPEGGAAPGAPVTPPAAGASQASPAPAAAPAPTAPVSTDVLPPAPEAPVREQGISAVSDVVLGDNIPDLSRGRRPSWPPLARLGNVTGDVVVRFSVDLAGKVTVHTTEGPDLLKAAAEQAVATWVFRRTAIDRLRLVATFHFSPERASAKVERVAEGS